VAISPKDLVYGRQTEVDGKVTGANEDAMRDEKKLRTVSTLTQEWMIWKTPISYNASLVPPS
jgi:hypothetical protein